MEASVTNDAITVGGTTGLAIRGLGAEAADLFVRQTAERSRDGVHSRRTMVVFQGACRSGVGGMIGLPFMHGHGRRSGMNLICICVMRRFCFGIVCRLPRCRRSRFPY